jgi:hypothetical protein
MSFIGLKKLYKQIVITTQFTILLNVHKCDGQLISYRMKKEGEEIK